MIIQSFNVTASSQRSSLTMQSGTITAQREDHSLASSGTGNTAASGAPGAGAPQNQNNSGAAQNQNSQGQNSNSQGQDNNSQGKNVNHKGQNVNNEGPNPNSLTNNGNLGNKFNNSVTNNGQNPEDSFQSKLEQAQNERIEELFRLRRSSNVSRMTHTPGNGQRIPSSPQELRARLSQIIYQLLTGRNHKPKAPPPNIENFDDWRGLNLNAFFGGFFSTASAGQVQGVGIIEFEQLHYESETVTYQAQGTVITADGKEINIDINMHMSREFVSYMNISTETRLLDPIVINYAGTSASLMGEKFLFDLTMDGELDSLSVLGQGSGFLAIDKNGDKKINDGSQLFGPNTGCGFDELRKYDTDGNGWIDENDEIFDKLVVWHRDKNGNDTVHTLRELGIGAIFLGDISTEFSFKGDNNETLGVMRSTSFFIKECGGTGTLSHIDLSL